MHTRSLVTRRTALLAGAGAIAAPFVITTPGFGQTGPIKLAGLVSLTGSGSPFGPNPGDVRTNGAAMAPAPASSAVRRVTRERVCMTSPCLC